MQRLDHRRQDRRIDETPDTDARGHCQQAAEKCLKARLEEAAIHFPKTHDLESLLHLLLPAEPLWVTLYPAIRRLTPFGVLIRYPGNDASKTQAKQAIADCKAIRGEVRLSLRLAP